MKLEKIILSILLSLSMQSSKIFSSESELNSHDLNSEKVENIIENSNQQSCPKPQPSISGGFISNIYNSLKTRSQQFKNNIFSLFTQTGSWWIRLLAALILGILLSLTPCIYPMIPITIGVLQINQSKSAIRSFLMAAAYTTGISIIFAIFGFFAAIGSCVFGQLQGSPYTIIPLAALLLYFGFSMFDFYQMYIPKFLQPKASNNIKGGSFLSAFAFGAISGTVASPCLSPGLLLILDYVSSISTSGNISSFFEGFLLLFIFGVGSSLPLLIIGTFSASMNIMPKAGTWMVEIKKLVGLMLISMAFYHLSHLESILPWYILSWIIAACIFILGAYYFKKLSPYDSIVMKIYKSIIGLILLITSGYITIQGYNAVYKKIYPEVVKEIWIRNYDKAKEIAKEENKPIFIDLGSSICTACKSIDKQIFQNPQVIQILEDNYVPLKINFDEQRNDYNKINNKFGPIKGFPTYLFVSSDNKLIKKLGSELGDLSIEEVTNLLINTTKNN